MSSEAITPEAVLVALIEHTGHEQGLSARQLAQQVLGLFATPDDERRLRSVIVQLRLNGHGICGTPSTGYFMARTDAELTHACQFLYDRAMTSLAQIAAMRRVTLPDLRGQLRLPALQHPLTAESTTEKQ